MRLFLLSFLALISAPADAQTRPPVPPPDAGRSTPQLRSEQPMLLAEPVALMIAAFDSDGDARVTRAEFDAGVRRSFDALDSAHAGTLGYIAFGDWALKWLGDRDALPSPFEVDRNGDNRVGFDELADRFALYFDRFDKNKDGVIERSELITFRPGGGERGPMGGRRGRGPGE